MDESASYTVAKGVLITCKSVFSLSSFLPYTRICNAGLTIFISTATLCAFVSGIHGITQGHARYGLLAGTAAVNGGITAATFFGIREYAVSPLLVSTLPWTQYTRRRRELGLAEHGGHPADEPLTFSEKRRHKLLDSGVSGAIAGAILRGQKAGRRAIIPGAMTVGAICIVLQYAFNEADIARLKYLSRRQSTDQELQINATPSPEQELFTPEPSPPFMQRMMSTIGIQKISDDEYLERMKKMREIHLRRIAELEKELESDSEHRPNNGSA
ncbi:hypothetical protein AX17_003888 [Amanita inopinata Kibby_2008]|nr:hypothetical protein AX17_003888 [Amanita inopinata Kibby_2008]